MMDGFEAVAEIREARAIATGGHHPDRRPDRPFHEGGPRALPGRGVRRLPLQADPFPGAVARQSADAHGPAEDVDPELARTDPADDVPTTGEFDLESALANLGGDEELLGEVVGLFLEDCPRLLAEIGRAIEERDAPKLGRLAHTRPGRRRQLRPLGVVRRRRALEDQGDWGEILGLRGIDRRSTAFDPRAEAAVIGLR